MYIYVGSEGCTYMLVVRGGVDTCYIDSENKGSLLECHTAHESHEIRGQFEDSKVEIVS